MPPSDTPGATEIEAAVESDAEQIAFRLRQHVELRGGPSGNGVWQLMLDASATIATLTAERDEAIGNAQHAIHQAEALAARVATLEAALREADEALYVVSTATAVDSMLPSQGVTRRAFQKIDAAVVRMFDRRAALNPRDGGGDVQS